MPLLLDQRLAVVDVGSNTTNLAVYAANALGALDRVADESEPLRLIRRLDDQGRFPPAALDRTVEVLRRFAEDARGMGARHVDVVATSAVRDAKNGPELIERVRVQLGLQMRILDGPDEGVCAAVGVTNTLPVQDGFLVDLGGGSLQVVELRDGRSVRATSLPLGALRLTDAFRTAEGIPTAAQVTALRRHVEGALRALDWFGARGTLVGVGGTIRAIGKVDRRDRGWPIGHGHGYLLTEDSVEAIWDRVSRVDAARRREIPGLAAHRVDLIVAGALVVSWVLRVSGFRALRVSSYGVREGAALRRLLGAEQPRVRDVREAGLIARVPGDAPLSERRAAAAAAWRTFDEKAGPDLAPHREAFVAAAWIRAARPVGGAAGAVAHLLGEPLQGFWQEETLALADLVADAPRGRLGGDARRDLRTLLDEIVPG